MQVTQLMWWHWWVIGALLAILEMVMPGTMLIFFAAAAGVVGLVALLVPALPWQVAVLIFGFLSIGTIFAWKQYEKRNPKVVETDHPTLNRRADQYVGRTVTLHEAIVNGQGKAKVDDGVWRVTGPDLPVGANVKVVAADGAFLRVEKV